MENNHYPFVNLPLPYPYHAMEPFIDEKTMRLHHDRHLQTYIDKLNQILSENPFLQALTLEQLIRQSDRLPETLRDPVRNNAGGVYNHRFFFDGLINSGKRVPYGELRTEIVRSFASEAAFKAQWMQAALAVFGSGYVWLVFDGKEERLRIVKTPNQNNPLEQGFCPVLTLDVWEHAYYLKHYNERAEYIRDWFHVVNWQSARERFRDCLRSGRS